MAEYAQLQAPIGGINAKLGEFNLPPQYAVQLVNLIPYGGVLCPRLPFTVKIDSDTITSSIPRWLHVYSGTAGDQLVVVLSNGNAWILNPDLSVDETVLADPGTCEQSVGFNFNGMVAYTVYPNGFPIQYEPAGGSAPVSFTFPVSGEWSSAVAQDVTGGHPFKNRVYWWSEKYRGFVYTALNAIGGTLEHFPLATVSQTGGTIRCITSLTMDGGAGPDDYLAVILATGEALIYQGSDPGDSNDWSIVGRFMVPAPLHAGAVTRIGGDVLMLTKQGLIPLQQYAKAAMGQIQVDWLDAINPILRDELNDTNAAVGNYGNIAYLPTRRWTVAITGPKVVTETALDPPSATVLMYGSCYVFTADASAWTLFETHMSSPETVPGNENLRNPLFSFGITAMAEANGVVYALVRTINENEEARPRLVAYELDDLTDPGGTPIRCGWMRGHMAWEPDAKSSEAAISWAKGPYNIVDVHRWYYRAGFNFDPSLIVKRITGDPADDNRQATRPFTVNGKGASMQETVIFDFDYIRKNASSSERALRLFKTEFRFEGMPR